jgi:Flp pilus assembly secretin CpaC
MRARRWWCGVVLFTFNSALAWSEEATAPAATQITSCPTVLPVEEGERSIVVPTTAQYVDLPIAQVPPNYVPHVATRTMPQEVAAAHALLQQKLAERDRLQREIATLRESTRTPEQILVRVKMLEVNLTKLRQSGVETPFATGSFRIADGDQSVHELCVRLQEQNFGKVLAEPSIVTTSGRPASLNVGGELPIPQPNGADGTGVRRYGTELNVLALSMGDNKVRLELRPRVSDICPQNAIVVGGQSVPALTVREIDTAIETEFGKTVVISGVVQQRKVSAVDAAGKPHDTVEEIALVVLVVPEIVR